jgi:regulator of protease activity HflC (stomatin/prohibitin superfamily)
VVNKYYNEPSPGQMALLALGAVAGIFVVIALTWGACAVSRVYDVWAERKQGEAELARAESNRSITVLEATAKEHSARHLANAEIIRAEGVAEANKIIGESLKGNEAYLRYLWIDGLQHSKGQVVYVPTEANLPILEAGKR